MAQTMNLGMEDLATIYNNQLPTNPETHPILRGSLEARGQRLSRVVSI